LGYNAQATGILTGSMTSWNIYWNLLSMYTVHWTCICQKSFELMDLEKPWNPKKSCLKRTLFLSPYPEPPCSLVWATFVLGYVGTVEAFRALFGCTNPTDPSDKTGCSDGDTRSHVLMESWHLGYPSTFNEVSRLRVGQRELGNRRIAVMSWPPRDQSCHSSSLELYVWSLWTKKICHGQSMGKNVKHAKGRLE
jgi:hypothetical protein